MKRSQLVWLIWLAPFLLNLPLAAEEQEIEFPYKGSVTADDVYIRSGPGKNYYPTQKMHRGETVEIYRHDPGGWFAIRPPQDSFSWVPSKKLQMRDDGVAEVLEDNVPALVGSLFSDVRDARQVRLKKGELVDVLGTKRFVDRAAGVTATWYQIAPPAGEFRWIHGKLIERVTPERQPQTLQPQAQSETDSDAKAERKRMLAKQFGIDVEPENDTTETEVVLLEQPTANGAVRVQLASADVELEESPKGVSKALAIEPEASDAVQQASWQSPGDFREHASPAATSASKTAASPVQVARVVAPGATRIEKVTVAPPVEQPIDEQLESINHKFTAMVAEEPTVWHFDDMQAELATVVARNPTALQKGRARKLADEIAEYEEIRIRYAEIATIQSETDRTNARLEETFGGSQTRDVLPVRFEKTLEGEQEVRIPRKLKTIEPGAFDGVGRLTPVKSRLPGAPSYALIDAAGEVQLFVTPEPGVQLEEYLGKQVGINGRKGFMPQLNMPHLTAQRIKELEVE